MSEELEKRLLAELFLEWLGSRTGSEVTTPAGSDPFRATLGGAPLALVIASVSSAPAEPAWLEQIDSLARLIGEEATPGALVWLPLGFALPSEEPGRAEIVDATQRTLGGLEPGQAGEARLPVTLRIQKRDEQGAYVTASGGLAQHWAKFTDRVQGYFQIDAASLYRPPAGEAELEALIESLVQASKGLQLGEIASVPAYDLLRVQRLMAGSGCAVVGVPPSDQSEQGAPLRKRLRDVLRQSGAALRAGGAPLRTLLLLGHYPTLDGEPVGPALRGQDPSLFDGIDLVALATDGAIKLLIDVTRQPELRELDRPAS